MSFITLTTFALWLTSIVCAYSFGYRAGVWEVKLIERKARQYRNE